MTILKLQAKAGIIYIKGDVLDFTLRQCSLLLAVYWGTPNTLLKCYTYDREKERERSPQIILSKSSFYIFEKVRKQNGWMAWQIFVGAT